MNWKNLGISLASGLAFAFVVYILTESDSSLGIGFVFGYLTYINCKINSLKEEAFGLMFDEKKKK